MNEDPKKPEENVGHTLKKLLLSEPILIALVPVIAYVLTYFYETGYCSVFAIPRDLIEINLINVFKASFYVLFVIWTCFNFLEIFSTAIFSSHTAIRKRVGILFSFLFISTLTSVFFSREWKVWIWFYAATGLYGLFFITVPYFSNKNNLEEYYKKLSEPKVVPTKKSILNYISDHLGFRIIEVIGIISFFGSLFFWAGISKATDDPSFTVISTNPESVVLATYGNKLICADFDRKNKTINGEFVIRKLDDVNGVMFHIENVGPLKLVKVPPGK